ncbi:MAG: DnaJ domain-containing protein [SAR324 cluster bacterium]|nr:DnaJ domain-containing protein [SAR324 cluster bacterium]
MSDNPYTILEIPEDADQTAIKKAYFAKIKQSPPDKNPEQFKIIRAAYESALKKKQSAQTIGTLQIMKLEKQTIASPLEILRSIQRQEVSISQLIKLTF